MVLFVHPREKMGGSTGPEAISPLSPAPEQQQNMNQTPTTSSPFSEIFSFSSSFATSYITWTMCNRINKEGQSLVVGYDIYLFSTSPQPLPRY